MNTAPWWKLLWQDRLVKIERGVWMLSAKGRYEDFTFFPAKETQGMAVAGTLPGGGVLRHVQEAVVVGEHLVFVATDGTYWCLTGSGAVKDMTLLQLPVIPSVPTVRSPLEEALRQVRKAAQEQLTAAPASPSAAGAAPAAE